MKKTSLSAAMIFILMAVSAQENTYNYLFKVNQENPLKKEWYIGLTSKHMQVNSNSMPGIEGGIMFNDAFLAGVYGMGTSGNFSYLNYNGFNHIMFGEGGLFAGYVSNPDQMLHFGGTIKLGYISLLAHENEIKIFDDIEPTAEDDGVVYHPEIFSEINVAKFLKIRVGLGYSFYVFDEETVLCNKDLDSWNMNVGLIFGSFYKQYIKQG